MAAKLKIIPIHLAEANDFVANFHRHNGRVRGHKFSIACCDFDLGMVGVAIVGRPLARLLQDGFTAEVLRLCTNPEAPKNVCSFLYSACWRVWREMGGTKLITYTLASESGASLRGAGWRVIAQSQNAGIGWENRPNRKWNPVSGQMKLRWEKEL